MDDYFLARTALEYAKEKGAPRRAPGLWAKADDSYRSAMIHFENKEYDAAKIKFLEAKKMAEKAENYTVLKKAESGEVE